MPPAGYPAFLQYLQSGRVRKVLLRVTVRTKKRDSSAISSGVAALKSAESTPVRDCPGLLVR